MAFVPDLFLANYAVHGDFSKVSKFAAYIFPPSGLTSGGLFGGLIKLPSLVNSAGLSFQCETAELPGYNINTVESKIYGAPYQVAATPVFADLSLTFICAADLWEKKFFDDWMNFILPKGTNRGYLANYKNQYASIIRVVQFTETGIPSLTIKFMEAFPYTIAPMTTNWADDGIHRLTVGFKYKHWERESLIASAILGRATQVEVGNISRPIADI